MTKKSFKERVENMKTEAHVLFLASKDPQVPWYAKLLMVLGVGYAVSPLDLIPDFVPVLGLLDDLVIVPAGVSFVVKMIPKDVMEECRRKAKDEPINTRTKWVAALIIVSIWAIAIYLLIRFVLPLIF
ncbi:MAG TPA: YkvA family protein [Candidatus Bathyarchaeia archaeon]|nr:YkvA family protein [Candidatus Bathyarchaeia archaeon]